MRRDDVVWLEVEDVDAAHSDAIEIGGGDPTVLNRGLIDSATNAPRIGYYDTLADLAAAYAYGIAKNHGYQDGNKRTAAIAMASFLGANGHPVVLSPNWTLIFEGVADGSISRGALALMIIELLDGDPIAIES